MIKPFQHPSKMLAVLVLALSGLSATGVSAAPIDYPFEIRQISGSTVVKSNGPGVAAGWESVGFDDSEWKNARIVPAPTSPQYPIPFGDPATYGQAQYIWYDPAGTSDGKNGVTEAFFRFHYGMPELSGAAFPYDAILSIVADDDFEVWFNGSKVATEADYGSQNDRGPDYIFRYDVTSLLQLGSASGFTDNVLAIRATDGSLNNPTNVYYEHLAFQLRIRTVPEPCSLALMMPILLGMGFFSKRRQ